MKSATLPSFWSAYRNLDNDIRQRTRKTYRQEAIWSVRITHSYRAIGILDEQTVTWFWIGNHADYEQFFG